MEGDSRRNRLGKSGAEEPIVSNGSSFSRFDPPRSTRRSQRRFNPFGKDALFSVADSEVSQRMSGAQVAEAMGAGRQALFADRRRSIGVARVECSACKRTTRISWPELILARFPVSLWIPFRSYDHLMRCPSCGKLTWSRVSLFG